MTSHNNRNCITIGVISIRFSNPRPLESQFIEGTNESTARVDSLVALMHHDPSDLGSLTLIQITDPTVLFYSIAPTLSKHCSELTSCEKVPYHFFLSELCFHMFPFKNKKTKKQCCLQCISFLSLIMSYILHWENISSSLILTILPRLWEYSGPPHYSHC